MTATPNAPAPAALLEELRAGGPKTQRLPVLRDSAGGWLHDKTREADSPRVPLNDEMKSMKKWWADR